jgi:hypothetical protein
MLLALCIAAAKFFVEFAGLFVLLFHGSSGAECGTSGTY